MYTDRSLIVHGVDHVHGFVPVHERGHDHGHDHDHGHVGTKGPFNRLK
jgi:hypothetical protein